VTLAYRITRSKIKYRAIVRGLSAIISFIRTTVFRGLAGGSVQASA